MCYQLKMSIIFLVVSGTSCVYSVAMPEDTPDAIEIKNDFYHKGYEILYLGLEQAKETLQKSPAIINLSFDGTNLLYDAIFGSRQRLSGRLNLSDQLDLVDLLLTHGADVNIQLGSDKKTVLMRLSSDRNLPSDANLQAIFKRLLQEAIDFSLQDDKKQSVRDMLFKTVLDDHIPGRGSQLVILLDEKKLQQEKFIAHWKTRIMPLIDNDCRLDEGEIAKIIAEYAWPVGRELGALIAKKSYQEIVAKAVNSPDEDNDRRIVAAKKGHSCVIS